jgi:hypothetical protein
VQDKLLQQVQAVPAALHCCSWVPGCTCSVRWDHKRA